MELNVSLSHQTVSSMCLFVCLFWLNKTNSCHNPTEFRLLMLIRHIIFKVYFRSGSLWSCYHFYLFLLSFFILLLFCDAQSIMILSFSKSVVVNKEWFCIILPLPLATFGSVGGHFWLSYLGRRFCLASNGWQPGMLLNILKCTGQLTTKSPQVADVGSAKFEKPCCTCVWHLSVPFTWHGTKHVCPSITI